MKYCPQCALGLDDNAVSCPNCNYVFTPGMGVQSAPVYNQAPAQPMPNEYQAPVQQTPPPVNQQNYNPYATQQPGKQCPCCGSICAPLAAICVNCGTPFNNAPQQVAYDDNPSTGLKILSFIIPLVGLILYLTNKDKKPVSAKAYGKMALIGFIVNTVISIIVNAVTLLDGGYYYY